MKHFPGYLFCLWLTSMSLSHSAAAEDAPLSDVYQLDLQELLQVNVSVRKRDEDITHLPGSLTLVTASEISDLHVMNFDELQAFLPNSASGSMRGIANGSLNIALQPANNFYLDGMFLPRNSENYPLFDMKQVEVARGPQGTLFGRNTMSGSINMISNEPDMADYAELTVESGNRGYRLVSGVMNHQLNRDWATRISLQRHIEDGYYHNLFDGRDVGNHNNGFMRLQVKGMLDDDAELLLAVDYYGSDRRDVEAVLRKPPTVETQQALDFWAGVAGVVSADQPVSSYTINQDQVSNTRLSFSGLQGHYKRTLSDNYSFVTLFSHRESEVKSDFDDEEMLPANILNTPWDEHAQSNTLELRLNADFDNWHWLIGAYGFREEMKSLYQLISSDAAFNAFVTAMSNGAISQNEGFHTRYSGDLETNNLALYSSVDVSLTEKLTISAGLRYTREKKDIFYKQDTDCFDLPGSALEGTCFYPQLAINDSVDDDGLTPMISLGYQLSPVWYLYGKYSEGFKSSGFNANLIQTGAATEVIPGLSYLPTVLSGIDITLGKEETRSLEIGSKSRLLNERLFISLSGFVMEYENFVVSELGVSDFDVNTADATVYGGEVDLHWQLSDQWMLILRSGSLRSSFDELKSAMADYKGNKLTEAPEWSHSIQVNYQQPLMAGLDWRFHLDYSWLDSYFLSVSNDEKLYKTEERDYLNLRTGLQGQGWDLYLWSRNLLDSKFETDNDIQGAFNLARTRLNPPRSFGVELILHF